MKNLAALIACSVVYATSSLLYQGHRYRVEYAYCPAKAIHVEHTTQYPAHITIYRGQSEIAQLDGRYVLGSRGKDRSRAYVAQVVGGK